MDYVEALEVIAQAVGDIRRRIVALETKINIIDGGPPDNEELARRIEDLENKDWNDSWETEVNSLIQIALGEIDFEEHVREAIGNMSFSITVD